MPILPKPLAQLASEGIAKRDQADLRFSFEDAASFTSTTTIRYPL
jgi:hypothetical protein